MTLMMAVAAPEPHHQSPLFHMNGKWPSPPQRISLCVGCGTEIYDQYILRVSPDLEWHAACLKCHDCHEFLDESCTCFVRDGKTYCKRDYLRLFGAKCSKCSMGFGKNDMVMRARNKIYHVDCFRCVVCSRQLTRGDEFALRDGDLFCKIDHDIVDKNGSLGSSASSSSSLTPLTPITPECLKEAMMGVSPGLTLLGSAPHSHHSMPSGGDISGHMNSANISPSGATGPPSHLTPLSGLGMDHGHTTLGGHMSPHDHSLTALQPMGAAHHQPQPPPPPQQPPPPPSHHHHSRNSNSSSRSSRSGKNSDHKPTRVRTVLNEKQLQTLRNCYNANPRPDALMKEQLVEITGLSPRVIRVWFQNKRCKDKKRTILMKQIQQQEKDGRQMSIGQMRGVPMIAGSPVRHDSPGSMGGGMDVHSYQPPWKALADYASLQPDLDPNAPQFQHLVSQMHGYNDGLSINDASLSSMGHAGPPTGPCTPLSYLDPSDMHPRPQ